MTLKAYLHDHLAAIAWFFIGLALLCFGLWLDPGQRVRWDTLLYIAVLVTGLAAALLAWHYTRTKKWVKAFTDRQSAGAEALDWPLNPASSHEHAAISEAYNHVLREHRQAQSELIARQQDQKAFIDSWVHEIKVPLAAAGLLQDSLDGQAPEKPLDDLALQLDKINFYVEQVLYTRASTVFPRTTCCVSTT